MENTQLMTEMIEKCRTVILNQDEHALDHQPRPLRREHLIWMCDRMIEHVDEWPAVKLNRWIGFIQCALIANRSIDLEAAKEMFNQAKNAFGEQSEDLVDHLDPDIPFKFDIGGES
jgi:hypothetical protein